MDIPSPELELQADVNFVMWVLGTKLRTSARAESSLHQWHIFFF